MIKCMAGRRYICTCGCVWVVVGVGVGVWRGWNMYTLFYSVDILPWAWADVRMCVFTSACDIV